MKFMNELREFGAQDLIQSLTSPSRSRELTILFSTVPTLQKTGRISMSCVLGGCTPPLLSLERSCGFSPKLRRVPARFPVPSKGHNSSLCNVILCVGEYISDTVELPVAKILLYL